ncbi:SHOCT domain-containing protein [Paenibacillus alginolyticus]|uniref:SHOCT domain-containing protein n=1 Tax=Paenibacillus alginolyticus TaxID=59839 RepID=UPI000684B0DD|nr:SHOCT domain-containing protein [Paenibacillus alginolyticus]MCY9667394.1 SHOCT domain-containing protein [Paenibacillus alginolyticus]
MDGSMMDGSMMFMMCVMMGIGFLLLIVVIYAVIRSLMRKSRVEDRPLMILKERYVNGEINDEEFEHKKTFLRK